MINPENQNQTTESTSDDFVLDFGNEDFKNQSVVTLDQLMPGNVPKPVSSLEIEVDEDEKPPEPVKVIEVNLFGEDKPKEITADLVIEEIKDTPIDVTQSEVSLKNKEFLSKLVELGVYKALDVVVDENDNEIPFADADINDDTLKQIIAFQEEIKKPVVSETLVDAKGISDFTKKLIEIEKKGGNVAEALASYNNYKEPLDSVDISSERGQAEAIYMDKSNKGMADEDIDTLIQGYQQKGILEQKGKEAVANLEALYEESLVAIEKKAEDAKAAKVEKIKIYKKEFKDSFTTKFALNESFQKRIIEAATKEDANGRFEVDKVYNEKRLNPAEAAELVFFIMDKEKYLEQKMEKVKVVEQLETLKKFRIAKQENTDSLNIERQAGKGSSNKEGVELSKVF
jgi:hypothetical protein